MNSVYPQQTLVSDREITDDLMIMDFDTSISQPVVGTHRLITELDSSNILPGYLAWGTSLHNIPYFIPCDMSDEPQNGQDTSQVIPFGQCGCDPSGHGSVRDSFLDPSLSAPQQYIGCDICNQNSDNKSADSRMTGVVSNGDVYDNSQHDGITGHDTRARQKETSHSSVVQQHSYPNPSTVPILSIGTRNRSQFPAASYDPLWMQKTNADPAIVNSYSTALKFENLLCQGVFRAADVFVAQVLYLENDGSSTEGTITLKPCGSSLGPTKRRRMDLEVTFSGRPGIRHVIRACTGVKDIAQNIQSYGFAIPDISPEFFTQNMHVMRDGQSLGSLGYVKKAYQMWRDRQDMLAAQSGQAWRQRRSKKGGANSFDHNGGFNAPPHA